LYNLVWSFNCFA